MPAIIYLLHLTHTCSKRLHGLCQSMLRKVLLIFGPAVFVQGREVHIPQQKRGSKMRVAGGVRQTQITVMYCSWRGVGAPVGQQVCQNLVDFMRHPEGLQSTEITSEKTRNEDFTLFSIHDGSLLRRQPRATTHQIKAGRAAGKLQLETVSASACYKDSMCK